MKKGVLLSIMGLIAAIIALIVVMVFNSSFARETVDYFSFFAGGFLIVDASYKMMRKKEAFFPQQFIRAIRLIIGVCILTIHIMQYVYGA